MSKKEKPTLFLPPPVSSAAPGALYQQIVAGLKRDVSEGRLPSGTPLPSFRRLARDLMVSLITVKRAYEELEREGIIYRKQGLGTYVSVNGAARSRRVQEERARELVAEAVREAREAGLGREEVLAMVRERFEKKEKRNPQKKR